MATQHFFQKEEGGGAVFSDFFFANFGCCILFCYYFVVGVVVNKKASAEKKKKTMEYIFFFTCRNVGTVWGDLKPMRSNKSCNMGYLRQKKKNKKNFPRFNIYHFQIYFFFSCLSPLSCWTKMQITKKNKKMNKLTIFTCSSSGQFTPTAGEALTSRSQLFCCLQVCVCVCVIHNRCKL